MKSLLPVILWRMKLRTSVKCGECIVVVRWPSARAYKDRRSKDSKSDDMNKSILLRVDYRPFLHVLRV